MLKSQEKQVAISKNRQDAAELTATVNAQADGPTDEQRNRLAELDREQPGSGKRSRPKRTQNPAGAGWDNGETAEIRVLRGRVALASYVGAALESRAVEGAEREFDTALSHPCPGMPS